MFNDVSGTGGIVIVTYNSQANQRVPCSSVLENQSTQVEYIIGNSIDSISTQIQILLHQLLTWSKLNSMYIHPAKSEVMFISKIPFIGPIRQITIDDKPINWVFSSSCLGVKLDNKLNWSPHIKMVNSNFNAKISKLKQMRTFNRSTLDSIYFKGILPSVTYCISL